MQMFLLAVPLILLFVVAEKQTQALVRNGPELVADDGCRLGPELPEVFDGYVLVHAVGVEPLAVLVSDVVRIVSTPKPERERVGFDTGYVGVQFLFSATGIEQVTIGHVPDSEPVLAAAVAYVSYASELHYC